MSQTSYEAYRARRAAGVLRTFVPRILANPTLVATEQTPTAATEVVEYDDAMLNTRTDSADTTEDDAYGVIFVQATDEPQFTYPSWDVLHWFPQIDVNALATRAQVTANSYQQLIDPSTQKILLSALPTLEALNAAYPDPVNGLVSTSDLNSAVGSLWSALAPKLSTIQAGMGALNANEVIATDLQQMQTSVSELTARLSQIRSQTSSEMNELFNLAYPAPLKVTASQSNSSGDYAVSVTWSAPFTNRQIASYTVMCDMLSAALLVPAGATTVTFNGLAFLPWSFSVFAFQTPTNDPAALPAAAVDIHATSQPLPIASVQADLQHLISGVATVTFTPPANADATFTRYYVFPTLVQNTPEPSATSALFPGLSPLPASYVFGVQTVYADGTRSARAIDANVMSMTDFWSDR